jgi:16S rRNA (cytosine967-C5)-methyltransferase
MAEDPKRPTRKMPRHGPQRQPPRGLSQTGLPLSDRSLAPRHAALRALDQVLTHHRMLSHAPAGAGLEPAEAARAGRLADMVLRHLGPLDQVIAAFVDRTPAPAVRNILRLGAAELLIAGEEPHGVVNAAVTLARASGQRTARASGMVNAVLRRIAEGGPALWADRAPQRLPGWVAGPIRKTWGEPALRAIEAAHERGAPLDLTPRGESVAIDGAERLPTGSLRIAGPVQVSALPGFADGAWWVQDAAAALPVRLLGDVAGKRVLDLCAAPGGKALQLAAAGAEVVALDISDARLDRLRENLARTGLSAEIVVADALAHEERYDAILLDAPCTATGTIRRHPDLPFVKREAEVEPLTRLQMRLLDHAIGLLAPGGRLVYCTCSLLPVEGEFQVRAALKRHEGLRVLPTDAEALGGAAEWATPEGGLRTRPDFWAEKGGIDGFYMACLTRD